MTNLPTRARLFALTTLLAGAIGSTGCASGLLHHRAAPVTRAAATHGSAARSIGAGGSESGPPRSKLEQQVAEAAEQAGLDPKQPYWPYRIGEIWAAADSLDRARAALTDALARDADYAPALSLVSKLDYRAGRHQEAVALLEAARGRLGAAMPADLLAALALHYDALGRLDLAAAAAAAPGGGKSEARPALVYVALRGDHPERADAPAAAAVDDEPRSAVNQNNYGITRLRAGDPNAAQVAFLKAIELDPKLPGPYYNLAILEKFYRFDDARAGRWFRAYHDRASDDPDSLEKALAAPEARASAGKER